MLRCVFPILVAVLVTGLIAGCDTNPVSSTQYDYSDSDVLSFAVGDSVTISADTFVGSVTFGPWVLEGVQVTITKWANVEADLDLLHVESSESDTVVRVEASNPENLNEVEVDIEILGPPGVSLDLASGVGSVRCVGRPGIHWGADVGVGEVEFEVPADVNISVQLEVGVGDVTVDFDVDGEVTARRVVGTIGTGDDGEILAHVGVGSITLKGEEAREPVAGEQPN